MITVKIDRRKCTSIEYDEESLKRKLDKGNLFLFRNDSINIEMDVSLEIDNIIGRIVALNEDTIEFKPMGRFFDCAGYYSNYKNIEAYIFGIGKDNKIEKVSGFILEEKINE